MPDAPVQDWYLTIRTPGPPSTVDVWPMGHDDDDDLRAARITAAKTMRGVPPDHWEFPGWDVGYAPGVPWVAGQPGTVVHDEPPETD